ncbi:hypothetical protein IC744_10475 [Microbacterium hominis]|nr:hypothetical protein [Microbacterium hominis]QOC27890.1 hypothetical protein IC744_10475 [Microbacterium hominis]
MSYLRYHPLLYGSELAAIGRTATRSNASKTVAFGFAASVAGSVIVTGA